MIFTSGDIDDLARGAALLGAGGGGDPYIGGLLLRQAMLDRPEIQVIGIDDVPDDAIVVPTAMAGAPTVLLEKLPNGGEAELALARLEKTLGKTVYAVMPAEIGGLNALIPLVLAARRGMPVVDADGMGRAFPELQMTTFHVHGQPLSPLAIADEHGNTVLLHTKDDYMAEHLARAMIVAMGATCQLCAIPMTGVELRRCAVPGTLTAAIGIGRTIREAREAKQDIFHALQGFLATTDYYKSSRVLFDGKIVDLDRRTTGGFARGSVQIDPIAPFTGRMEIQFQNEHLVARLDGKTQVIVPDIIAILDRETAEPITTDGLRYGQRVKVMAISAAPIMRSDAALAVFGPRAFSIDEDFVPLEQINPI